MTEVYLIRHGETANNSEHRYNGCRSNQPLSPRGEAQAAALGTYFAAHPVDTVHVSHLTRAKQTAMLAFAREESALCVESDLHEVDLGLWDGMLHAEVRERYPEEWYNSKHRASISFYPGGERPVDAAERIFGAFLRIVRAHRGKRIAIVAHSTILALLTLRIFNWHLDRKSEMAGISNASFHLLQIDDNNHARMACWNYTEHLPADLRNKPSSSYSNDVAHVAAECEKGTELPL